MSELIDDLIKYEAIHEFASYLIILEGLAQTAAVGSIVLIESIVYTELSGRSGRPSFDRKVCLCFGVHRLLFDVNWWPNMQFVNALLPMHQNTLHFWLTWSSRVFDMMRQGH